MCSEHPRKREQLLAATLGALEAIGKEKFCGIALRHFQRRLAVSTLKKGERTLPIALATASEASLPKSKRYPLMVRNMNADREPFSIG